MGIKTIIVMDEFIPEVYEKSHELNGIEIHDVSVLTGIGTAVTFSYQSQMARNNFLKTINSYFLSQGN